MALSDAKTRTRHLPLQKAVEAGAIAVFSEKYSELVRVVEVSPTHWYAVLEVVTDRM